MRFRLSVALLTAALCAGLLAGCGGVSKAEYEKDVQRIGNKAEKDFEALESGQPTAKDLEQAEKALDETADELDDVTPPDDVQKLHDDLVDTLHDAAELMGQMGPVLDKAMKDPANADQDELAKLSKEFEDVDQRMTKIQKGYADKKYDVGLGD